MDTQNYADYLYAENSKETEVLVNNVQNFPVSSIARCLLLYHFKKNNDSQFEDFAQKTGIYINNPLWIEYQFSKINFEIPENSTDHDESENQQEDIEQIKEDATPDFAVNPQIPPISISENEPEEARMNPEVDAPELINNQENPTDQKVSQEAPDEEPTVAFEPLHTVDYFASQGIKLSEETLANDQLGQQVKSFTAWLKSMKKLHPGQLPEQNEVIEKIIQSSSEASNQNANVLTEAMAEVLVKQGKHEKAIEMYEKLSLLNPSKSPYFAAKIESLKII